MTSTRRGFLGGLASIVSLPVLGRSLAGRPPEEHREQELVSDYPMPDGYAVPRFPTKMTLTIRGLLHYGDRIWLGEYEGGNVVREILNESIWLLPGSDGSVTRTIDVYHAAVAVLKVRNAKYPDFPVEMWVPLTSHDHTANLGWRYLHIRGAAGMPSGLSRLDFS